jgi:hypothetical protein
MKLFDQLLSASICAPSLDGPKQLICASLNTSLIPSARGSSGPTTTRSILLFLHHDAIAYNDCFSLN